MVAITADSKTLVFVVKTEPNSEANFFDRSQNVVYYDIIWAKVGWKKTLKSSWDIIDLKIIAGSQAVVANAQSGVLLVIDPIICQTLNVCCGTTF